MDPDELQNLLNTAADTVSDSVIPTMVFDDRKRLDSIGAGVLMNAMGRHVLITAAHVIRDSGQRAFVTRDRNGEIFALGHVGVMSESEPTTDVDRVDLAVIELYDTAVVKLQQSRACFLDMSMLHDTADTDSTCVVIGFPSSRNKWKRERTNAGQMEKVLPFEQAFAYARPCRDEVYGVAQANVATHLVLEFRHLRSKIHGTGDVFPHPRGMSGGGVFRLGSIGRPRSPTEPPELIGIGTRYLEKRGLIEAVRAKHVLAGLAELS